jgi:hypothetical protein
MRGGTWLFIFVILGALSPTICSYIVLKKNHRVKNLREWMSNIFAFKAPSKYYLLILLFVAVYYLRDKGKPTP